MPSTGMRDAVAMPITSMAAEPATHTTGSTHSGSAESVIGKEDRFEGTLLVQRGLRILGHVEGQIEAATSVTIEEGAKVDASLTADEAIIAGEYSGKLVCRQRLEVRSTGKVKGEIETVRLMLHEGGFIDGALHMQKAAASAAGASIEVARAGESLRSGISPRSTVEAVVEPIVEPVVETPASEAEPDREHVTAGSRGSSSGSGRSVSR